MPTTLRTFARQNRNGTQQTAWRETPERFDYFQLIGDATNATLSNEQNRIRFEFLARPIGGSEQIIQVEEWFGGTHVDKFSGQTVPNPINVTFGPVEQFQGQEIALRAIFSRNMSVGADLIGLP